MSIAPTPTPHRLVRRQPPKTKQTQQERTCPKLDYKATSRPSLDNSKEQQLQRRHSLLTHHPKRKMAELGRSQEGIAFNSPAMACIAPLNISLGQRRTPEECNLGPPSRVFNTILPTEIRRRGRRHHADPTRIEAFYRRQHQTPSEREMCPLLDDADTSPTYL
jgi:hypothetical protein